MLKAVDESVGCCNVEINRSYTDRFHPLTNIVLHGMLLRMAIVNIAVMVISTSAKQQPTDY
jgi:hypothetical protein